ncbi:PREDICTED: fatty acyl-CoA reductase 3-like [Nelumbo nucifera]|uniref:Fatty acyl-CoA reductase n=2 Tax=Nelumbo nucifera TaxID=4432 RepID=A0A822XKI2_NELNU|nr:PREDICTED: fatty acyl-CoA reductase 3-like [Nelumbo nucifera]DAD19325.1 TPA_asm: hypothetical protein HUJ06_020788 [Nelumbo nucifera]
MDQLPGIACSLENKSILVTGSTGFLAKMFVEKVLRIQPNVKRLFLLLRVADAKSAQERLSNEVVGKELFRVLRQKHGECMDSFISDKVTPVAGDVTWENLGISDSNLLEEIWGEVDFIVHSAATTKFDERYDTALNINVLGAKHVLDFAKGCVKLQTLIHVSTAYAAGEKPGIILEKPFKMGETLNGKLSLDIMKELKIVEQGLQDLWAKRATKDEEKLAMKQLGLQRARLHGWPNTYVFTKAMGEMLLGQMRENVPLVIMRPTIVTSTYREPFPGWIEGFRTVDAMMTAYAKAKMTFWACGLEMIVDLIPGDMVVNSMVAAMVAHANQRKEFIYQVGSSRSNPIKGSRVHEYVHRYFSINNPFVDKKGNPIKIRKYAVLTSKHALQWYMLTRYMLPLKGLQVLNIASCRHFQHRYKELNRKIKYLMFLMKLYQPFLFFKGIFDDTNLEKLRMATFKNAADANTFCFDTKCIEWEDYLMNIHIPGALKYAIKS